VFYTAGHERADRPGRWGWAGRLVAAMLLAVTIIGGLGTGSPAVAQNDREPFWGYLWADQETASASYTPSTGYQHTSTGQQMTVHRESPGEYVVGLPVLANVGNVQVTAYGTTAVTCIIGSWAIRDELTTIRVYCWDAAGKRTDSRFSFFVSSGVTVAPSAYTLWINDQLQTMADFNATGGANTITHNSTGNYLVKLPGVGANPTGNVQVTPFVARDSFGRDSCTVERWVGTGEGDLDVSVHCFDSDGQPADGAFSLLYVANDAATEGAIGGTYWTESKTNMRVQNSSAGEEFTVTTSGTGIYEIRMPGLGINTHNGNVQVTAIDDNHAIYCLLTSIGSDEPSVVLHVQCADAAGQAVDGNFSVMWVRA
jgi:hypothetical protein